MRPILNANQIRAADKYTIEHEPIDSIDLMERASQAFVDKFKELIPIQQSIAVVCGPGNNGGDGFAIGRLLQQQGYTISCYEVFSKQRSLDCELNRAKYLASNPIHKIPENDNFTFDEDVIIDGIFGSGLNRAITEGVFKSLISGINNSKNIVVAIDIPSGLFCDQVDGFGVVVQANHTITFECPKLSFLLPETGNFVGEFHIVDIGLNVSNIDTPTLNYHLLEKSSIRSILKRRKKFSHKGNYGRVQIIAGSKGKMGAAFLCGKASFMTGAGLVTMNIPGTGNEIIQTSLPEAMTIFDDDQNSIIDIKVLEMTDVFCLGPGIGTHHDTQKAIEKFLKKRLKTPLVLDADALNIIALKKELLELIPSGSIITPHPKEFERLFGVIENSLKKIEFMSDFSKKTGITIVSKGAHSVISDMEGKIYFNNSGNPGLATAGSGDVLAGMITGLLAQGINPRDAALAGVYLHGLAGDIAEKKVGEMSLMASDLLITLPKAICNVNNAVFI